MTDETDNYVAWCRYTYDDAGCIKSIVTCDSDAKGAFKVYRAAPAVSSSERRCGECHHSDATWNPVTALCEFDPAPENESADFCGHKCVFPATGAASDLISRDAAMRAACSRCANPDRYGPPVPIKGSARLFHFRIADDWNAGQCDAQVIKELPSATATGAAEAGQFCEDWSLPDEAERELVTILSRYFPSTEATPLAGEGDDDVKVNL